LINTEFYPDRSGTCCGGLRFSKGQAFRGKTAFHPGKGRLLGLSAEQRPKPAPIRAILLDFDEVGIYIGYAKSHGRVMMRHHIVLAVVFLLFSSVALGEVIQPSSLRAQDDGTGVVVRWTSLDETGVAGYMIERKAGGSGSFVPLVSQMIPAKGNSQDYKYDDETAFKTTGNFYQYRLTPVNGAGQPVGNSYYVSIDHSNVSSVRRTWGSIKAMFR
jgi:hypothetical protein